MTCLGRIYCHRRARQADQRLVATDHLELLLDRLLLMHIVQHVIQFRNDSEHVLFEKDNDVLLCALSTLFRVTELMNPLQRF